MARGRNLSSMLGTRRRLQLNSNSSDESDEDYKVYEDEEFDESGDEYLLAEDDVEVGLGELEEEEDESVGKKVKKNATARGQKGFQGRMKRRFVKPKEKKVKLSEEEEQNDDNEEEDYEGDDFKGRKQRKKIQVSREEDEDDLDDEKPRKKSRKKMKRSYLEENQVDVSNDSYDEEDEESTPSEDDVFDDEEDSVSRNKCKVDKPKKQKSRVIKTRKRKRNARVSKKAKAKRSSTNTKSQTRRRRPRLKESKDTKKIVKRKKNISKQERVKRNTRMMKPSIDSDSDFASPGSSDYEYTTSEEEREQVREARKFCRAGLSNHGLIEKEVVLPSDRRHPGGKGKDTKVEEMQVCGICLSEEGKKTIRGKLDCCSHYFCFACVIEWSKVESRCPVCKQRFVSISKNSLADAGHELRPQVVLVPERDQVYQPTEEELMGYFDPYANTACTECEQGGDDALMLLCDICDSPAHTYCVGLGHEVPEGNWYCNGCRPTVHATPSALAINSTPDQGENNCVSIRLSPVSGVHDMFILNEVCASETQLTRGVEPSPSPRYSTVVDYQLASPLAGSGVSTVSNRRRIHRQMHQLLNSRSSGLDRIEIAPMFPRNRELASQHIVAPERMSWNMHVRRRVHDDESSFTSVATNSLFSTQVGQGREIASQNVVTPERMSWNMHVQRRVHDDITSLPRVAMNNPFSTQVGQDTELASLTPERMSCDMHVQQRVRDDVTSLPWGREVVSPRLSGSRGQVLGNQASTSAHSLFGTNEIVTRSGMGLAQQQLNPCSTRSAIGSNVSRSPNQFAEASHASPEKEQVQSMVRSHLKSLSKNLELGYSTFKYIARRSTHTILAACGLEHRKNEVHNAPRPLICIHSDRVAAGQTSPMKGQCSSCFDLYVRNVVRDIMSTRTSG